MYGQVRQSHIRLEQCARFSQEHQDWANSNLEVRCGPILRDCSLTKFRQVSAERWGCANGVQELKLTPSHVVIPVQFWALCCCYVLKKNQAHDAIHLIHVQFSLSLTCSLSRSREFFICPSICFLKWCIPKKMIQFAFSLNGQPLWWIVPSSKPTPVSCQPFWLCTTEPFIKGIGWEHGNTALHYCPAVTCWCCCATTLHNWQWLIRLG